METDWVGLLAANLSVHPLADEREREREREGERERERGREGERERDL